MSGTAKTEARGFGAPEYGKHCFFVEIPLSSSGDVEICEDFGIGRDVSDGAAIVKRAVLARGLWTEIRDDAAADFNARLKVKKLNAGKWSSGRNELDRFLGRELCVLAWAAEHADREECPAICERWRALRPEERWWLYSKTAAEAGGEGDMDKGWRKALYCALSEKGSQVRLEAKVQSKKKKRAKADGPLVKLLHDAKRPGGEGEDRDPVPSPLPESEERGTI